ncbi:MAG: hypothetical protein OWT27_10110 [Firmicutes bacterium]|nr:hypothetical protein [Bacillota bacterium]
MGKLDKKAVSKRENLRKQFEEGAPKPSQAFQPDDEVRVSILNAKNSPKQADGFVEAVYPKFVLVQLEHYRECFGYHEIRLLTRGR